MNDDHYNEYDGPNLKRRKMIKMLNSLPNYNIECDLNYNIECDLNYDIVFEKAVYTGFHHSSLLK